MSLWPKPLLNRVVDQRIMISLVYEILFHTIATRTKWLVARGTIFYSTVVQHQSIVRLSVRLHVSDKDLGKLMDSLEVDFTSRYYGINTPSCRLHWRREVLTDALKMTPKKNIKNMTGLMKLEECLKQLSKLRYCTNYHEGINEK